MFPEPDEQTLPNDPDNLNLQVSVVFFCGIVRNTTDYTSLWTTPTGASIEATDIGVAVSDEKYTLQNGNIGIDGFPQGSTLSVMRLLHTDAGEYTCSITFTDTDVETVTLQLTLNGMSTKRDCYCLCFGQLITNVWGLNFIM